MRKKSYSPHKKQSTHPTFLIDDDSRGSHAYCSNCVQYEEDISILQQKLMETHNKLIEQIDICREQQIKIIKLTANYGGQYDQQQNNNNVLNVNQRNQSGKILKKNDEQYLHSIEPLIQAKTQLLRNDLEAMRSKVLSQINKSNRLKEQNRELQMKHEKQLSEYREKIRRIETNRNKLIDENQRLTQQVEQLRKQSVGGKASSKCSCGFESKYYQLDKAFMNQRTVTNQLIQQNNRLQNKIHDLFEERIKGQNYQQNDYSQRRVDEIRTQPKKKKYPPKKPPKEEFEATKNLIKRLQQAEYEMRNRQDRVL